MVVVKVLSVLKKSETSVKVIDKNYNDTFFNVMIIVECRLFFAM